MDVVAFAHGGGVAIERLFGRGALGRVGREAEDALLLEAAPVGAKGRDLSWNVPSTARVRATFDLRPSSTSSAVSEKVHEAVQKSSPMFVLVGPGVSSPYCGRGAARGGPRLAMGLRLG